MPKEIFEVGKPIPRVWLHNELDFADTIKYLNDEAIKDNQELDRLVTKYLNGKNYYDSIS